MAADQLSEQEIQFRKRARRRLIGAVALVLLMVTVLPMVLDERESTAPQPEIAISIPSQDGSDFSSKIVPTAPSSAASVPVPVAPAGAPATSKASIKPASVAPEVAKPAAPASAKKDESGSASAIHDVTAEPVPVESPVSAEVSSSPDATPAEPQAATEQKAAEKSKSVTASVSKTEKPAQASKPVQLASPVKAVTDKSSADKAQAKKGSFSVQLGVLLATANIKPLQAKVGAQGLHSYTETLNTPKGTMVRLRAGPFATRPEAEQAYEKLKAVGLSGIIVTNK